MALVKEFSALRFKDKAEIASLCCPPYDIISEAEKSMYYSKNAHNIMNLELPGQAAEDYETAAKKTTKKTTKKAAK